MRLLCEQCGAQFTLDDLRRPAGDHVACPRCESSVFLAPPVPARVDRNAATVEVARAGATPIEARVTPMVNAALPRAGDRAASLAARVHGAPCRRCGEPLTDPVLAELGVCERCRDEQRQGRQLAPEWDPLLDTGEGAVVGAEDLLGTYSGPAVGPAGVDASLTDLEIAADDQRFGVSETIHPAELVRAVDTSEEPTQPLFRPRPRVSAVRVSVAVLGTVALAAVAAALVLRPWAAPEGARGAGDLERPARGLDGRGPVLPVLDYKLDYWRASTASLEGGIADLMERGRRLALEDRAASYRQAAQCFQRVLVLDRANLEAAARWAEVVVLARGERFDADEAMFVRELIGEVLAKAPELAVGHRARAQFLILGGQYDEARAAAEQAYKSSPQDERAVALLTWGRTYLTQSAPIAQEKFEAALELDPSLKAAHYFEGLAAENAGRYARALTAFERRLALDHGNRDALRGIVRVYATVGEEAAGREVLAQNSGVLPGHESSLLDIGFAVRLGRLDEADRLLRKLLTQPDLSAAERVAALTRAAEVARLRNRPERALEHVHAALALAPTDAAAHFQGLLAALAQRDGASAREHLAGCEARIGDAGRRLEYRARVELVQGDPGRAAATFRKAIEAAPSRMGAYLALSGTLMRLGDENGAFATMRHALDLDPASLSRQRAPAGALGEPAVEVARLARGAFSLRLEPKWPGVYEAVVAFHLGETAKASAVLDRVLAADATSLPALIYRAQIEIDAGRFEKALRFAERAAKTESQSLVATYLVGRAHDGLHHTALARAAYQRAQQRDPRLLAPMVRLGLQAEAEGRAAEARDDLLQVLATDGENLEVRGALFRLGY